MSRRENVYETRDLVDAGVFHQNILARCPMCDHWGILDTIDLWGLFCKKGWSILIAQVPRRLRCSQCAAAGLQNSRPIIDLVRTAATVKLPYTHTHDFAREVKRRR